MTALPPGHTPRTPSAADAAQTAAEAIRHLNHLIAPQAGYPGLDVPGDLYDTLGALTATAQRLNQTLDQLSRWVIEQGQAGRITTRHLPLPWTVTQGHDGLPGGTGKWAAHARSTPTPIRPRL